MLGSALIPPVTWPMPPMWQRALGRGELAPERASGRGDRGTSVESGCALFLAAETECSTVGSEGRRLEPATLCSEARMEARRAEMARGFGNPPKLSVGRGPQSRLPMAPDRPAVCPGTNECGPTGP